MDVSDGLVQDLGHIASASGMGAEIMLDTVPLSRRARAATNRVACVTGGDDYELLFAAPPSKAEIVAEAAAASGSRSLASGTW